MAYKKLQQISLAQLELGEQGRLVRIDGGRKMIRRLEVLGLRPGKVVRIVSTVFERGPVIVDLDGRLLAIGRGQAQKIFLEKI